MSALVQDTKFKFICDEILESLQVEAPNWVDHFGQYNPFETFFLLYLPLDEENVPQTIYSVFIGSLVQKDDLFVFEHMHNSRAVDTFTFCMDDPNSLLVISAQLQAEINTMVFQTMLSWPSKKRNL